MCSERRSETDDWQWLDDPLATVEELERRFAAREADVQAFVPEPGRFERLYRQASELRERFSQEPRPPLYGVPVGIKDVFHVEGLPTHAGSRLPADELEGPQSPAVTDLIAAGALIVGKAACTEFAYFAPGPTHNPLRLGYTPGGSSSGSAAAVAAGLCPLTLGTQTIGSIVRPASYCGVVGFKPTYERISREGVIPLSESLDHIGFFTPELAGAELVAGLLCESWRGSPTPSRTVLGIPEGAYLDRADAEARRHFAIQCDHLRDAGWTLQTVDALQDIDAIENRHRRIVAADAARHHQQWYERHAELYRPKTVELIELGQTIDDTELERLRESRVDLYRELTALMDTHGIDAWLTPGAPGTAPEGLESTGDPILNLPWSHTGMPSLALPAGRHENGLPLGLQLVSRQRTDEELFAWGTQLSKDLFAEMPSPEVKS